ncbi:MAG: MotA/TolQ/ExbB proton channel family protein [Xanthomonadales bacterium]|nr:MotA/TolQ/ExbB proton channel family protein [Xanthomonadales bacterium]
MTLFDQFAEYLAAGGHGIMLPLLAIAFALWYAIGARWSLLRRGSNRNVRVLLSRYERGAGGKVDGVLDAAVVRGLSLRGQRPRDLRRVLDDAFAGHRRAVRRHRVLIGTLVAIAPLLGLLGTVNGMIVTFDSLADMALFTQGGGIAAGISTALYTTQMGLAVAIPGYLAKGVLDRRQAQIEMDLAQLRDILVATSRPVPAPVAPSTD